MSQEREAVKQRVIKLLNMTVDKGASEAEAMTAMEKAGELMAFYDIQMTELQLKSTRSIKQNTGILKYDRSILGDTCAVVLAQFCDCLVWRSGHSSRGDEQHTFFGLPQDVEVAVRLQAIIRDTIDSETALFRKSSLYQEEVMDHGKTMTRSFIIGMETRINERLRDLIKEKQANINRESRTGTALVLMKIDQVKQEAADLGYTYGVTKGKRYRLSKASFEHGIKKGEGVNLGRMVGNEGLSKIGHL